MSTQRSVLFGTTHTKRNQMAETKTTTTDFEAPQRSGRPRDARAHRAILDAVLSLLAEVGYVGLTIEGVAAKAGVAKTTVYRRWPSKASLVLAAVEDVATKVRIPDTGTVRGDAAALLRDVIKVYTKTVAGRVIPGLIADMAENPDLAEAIGGLWKTRREIMFGILERGISRGELRPDIDLELTADLMHGPVYYRFLISRFLISRAALSARFAEEVVDAALLGSAPRT
jgi:AcrR family transcriptional regulator